MRTLGRSVAAVFLSAVSLVAADAPCDRSPLVVTRARLWTSTGPVENAEIVTVDGRVRTVGRAGTLARPPGSRVIDAAGQSLLPGLIDAHAHLVLPGDAPKEFSTDPRGLIYPVTGQQLLRSGVTTARVHLWDLGDGAAFARDTVSDCFAAPRLEMGGPGFMGGAPELNGKNVWGVRDGEDARRKIAQIQAAGARWIALHDLAKFEAGQLEDLIAEARRTGLRVMAAGDRPSEVQRALDLGVDSIEYIDRTSASVYPDELIEQMKRRGASLSLVPPIGYYHRYVEFRRSPTLLDDPMVTELMPAPLRDHLLADLREQRTKPSNPSGATIERAFPLQPGKFRQLREAGLNLVVGTDCGSPAGFQTDAIWWELETWRQLGVPVAEVISAATTRASALLRDPDVGRLEPGSRADFVVYAGRLTGERLDVRRVRHVAKGGVLFVKEGRWVGAPGR